MRYALGAGRARVLRQVLPIEGLLLGTVGGGLGLLLAPAAASILVRQITGSKRVMRPFSTSPSGAVLCCSNLVLSVGISLPFSVAPAWQMMKPRA